MSKWLKNSNSNKLYKLYDTVLVKFPELIKEYGWKKSDTFTKNNSDEPSKSSVQRTGDTEELG